MSCACVLRQSILASLRWNGRPPSEGDERAILAIFPGLVNAGDYAILSDILGFFNLVAVNSKTASRRTAKKGSKSPKLSPRIPRGI